MVRILKKRYMGGEVVIQRGRHKGLVSIDTPTRTIKIFTTEQAKKLGLVASSKRNTKKRRKNIGLGFRFF